MIDLVSIIVTTHKGSDSIKRAVESVVNQTYSPIEIIVVDDNGLGTEEQIKTEQIVSTFKNVKYIAHEVNQNGSVARNTGARASNGKWLSFLDDDDEFLPTKIEKQINKFRVLGCEYGLVYCSFENIDETGKQTIEIADKSGYILAAYMTNQVIIATSLFIIRKSVFDEMAGFDESFRRHQDWEFVARVASKYKIAFVKDVCVVKHSINRSLPKDVEMMENYRMHYLKKLQNTICMLREKERKKVYCYHYLCFVKEYVKKGRYNKFFMYMKESKAPLLFCGMFLNDCIRSIYRKFLKQQMNN